MLLQRSEGGGLGIGGGSGFMTARGAANALTRATGILAIVFFATSLGLSLIARYGERPIDILDRVPGASGDQNGGDQKSGGAGVLDKLGGNNAATPPATDSARRRPPRLQPAQPAVPSGQ